MAREDTTTQSDRPDRLASIQSRIGKKSSAAQVQPQATPQRKRHSLYFSTELNSQIDTAFKQTAHNVFPREIEKSDFLEVCLQFCLDHMGEIEERLR